MPRSSWFTYSHSVRNWRIQAVAFLSLMSVVIVPWEPDLGKSLQARVCHQRPHQVARGSSVSPQGTERRLYYLSRGRWRHTNLFGIVWPDQIGKSLPSFETCSLAGSWLRSHQHNFRCSFAGQECFSCLHTLKALAASVHLRLGWNYHEI